MAILYGTQSNGETLPVEVNEFGQLVAKGIQGPEGPPGAPGIGQLPPDPFEGAILGWEDGALAWLGGSVPLPAGTYGPIVYIASEQRLEIPQDGSLLVNGQQLYMSSAQGDQVSAVISTDAISNVSGGTSLWNQSKLWRNGFSQSAQQTENTQLAFDGNITGNGAMTPGNGQTLIWAEQVPVTTQIRIFGDPANGEIDLTGGDITIRSTDYVPNPGTSTQVATYLLIGAPGTLKSIIITSANPNGRSVITGIEVDGLLLVDSDISGAPISPTELLFPTTTRFDVFQVGDEVQPGVLITDIDDDAKKIQTNGGLWIGADGSGSDDPDAQSTVSRSMSGQGSVLVGSPEQIDLRADNGEWINGFYVTAPEQLIAARKVGVAAIKRNTKRDELR